VSSSSELFFKGLAGLAVHELRTLLQHERQLKKSRKFNFPSKSVFCVEDQDPDPEPKHENILAFLRIHGISVWIRIRILIRGSMPLTNGFGLGSGSCYVPH